MLDNPKTSAGIITKESSKSVAQTVDRLTRVIADRGLTLLRVIDHSSTAERVGVQMPDSKLVMFGKPTVGAALMLEAPLAGLDLPLKVLVLGGREGSGRRELQRTGVPGRAAPHRGCPACALRRS